MDMMELRRSMLMALVGGNQMLGRFSKYQKIDVVAADFQLTAYHTLGEVPKVVIVNTESSLIVVNYIKWGIISGESLVGGMKRANGGVNVWTGTTDETATLTGKTAIIGQTMIKINGSDSPVLFYNGATYTIELYA